MLPLFTNHFVTAKGTADVVLKATLDPADACDDITWESPDATITSPGFGTDKCTAKVSRGTSKKIRVKIKCDGVVLWEGFIWVVWSTISTPTITITSGDAQVTTGDDTTGPGMGIRGTAGTFTCTISPAEITDITKDIPNLTGANTIAAPAATQTHVVTEDPFSGGVNAKWDESRRIRIKILNPHLYETDDLPKVSGHLWNNQPAASTVPESYQADEVIGNDDTSTTDPEDNDPYTAPNVGKLTGYDAPQVPMRHSTGKDDETFEIRYHFGEFARLQLGVFWYPISDFRDWKVHYKFKRVSGKWTDDGSFGAANNTDF